MAILSYFLLLFLYVYVSAVVQVKAAMEGEVAERAKLLVIHEFYFPCIEVSYSSPQPQPEVQALQKIREQAQIYGRDPKKAQNLTEYQKRINQCSEGLRTNSM